MKSFGEVLAGYQGLAPGFNFLRLALALTIVFYHVVIADGYWDAGTGPLSLWFFEYSLVPMFFALSGFLITASAQRLDLANFLLNRALRIVPRARGRYPDLCLHHRLARHPLPLGELLH